jgi:ectoine hydroxylase-related dioxygenase (phytanoyl-CoA dioxygenase family)
MLTAWVPFHDCDEEMGTLMVVDGSHKWPASNLRGFNAKDFAESEKPLKEKGQYAKIPMNLKKGQVSFHHCLAVHGSDRNRSASPRVSLAIHLQDGANRYREYITEKGVRISLFNDKLCRHSEDGTPDYTDPKVFPVLWGTPI